MTLTVRYYDNFIEDKQELYVWDRTDRKTTVYTVVAQELKEGLIKPPFLTTAVPGMEPRQFLQACCDAAFDLGIYPRQLADKRDELTATKAHLEDMRSLVFKTGIR